jgi:hypothetical protein
MSVWSRLQADDTQQVNDFMSAIFQSHRDCGAGGSAGKKLGMFDGKRPSIGQANFKGLKRLGLMHFLQLFHFHNFFSWEFQSVTFDYIAAKPLRNSLSLS